MITFTTRLLASLLLAFSLFATGAAKAEPEDTPLFTQAELDQMLAPVALYPDELLSQLLMAATYPLEVVEAARFARAHPELKGQDAVRAATDKSWDPSVKAMLAFPQILDRMDQDLEWTRRLGDAFLAQQEQVMDTVQSLRKRADEAGNLKETEHVRVVREERTIIVRNRYPDVVYVPYYDPSLIYGSWWWPDYQPVRWSPWTGYRYYAGYSGFFWGPSIVVGHGFFFSGYDWRDRYVRIVEVPPFYYRHAPPPHYRWEHEYNHRKGVPYRQRSVYDRYHDEHDPVPGRPPRDRHEDGGQGRHGDGQPPQEPRDGGAGPRGDGQQGPHDGHGTRDGQGDGGQGTHDGGDGHQAPGEGGQGTHDGGQGPHGGAPDRDPRDGRGGRGTGSGQEPPATDADSRAPRGSPEVDAAPPVRGMPDQRGSNDGARETPAAPTTPPRNRSDTPAMTPAVPSTPAGPDDSERRGDREGRADREDSSGGRRDAPVYTAPRQETPTYSAPRQETPRYTPPPRETPTYSAPRETPTYSAPRETPTYSAPRETPTYNAPRETPTYSAPRQETPRYTPPPRETPTYSAPRETPTYNAPRETPSYSAPRETPTYSAPRQETPRYTPPPRETPTYSAPRETPSYSAPRETPTYNAPRSAPPPDRSGDRGDRGDRPNNRERPDPTP